MLLELFRLCNLSALCQLWLQPLGESLPPLLSRGNLYVVSSHADYKQARSTVCGRVCVIVLIVEAQLCAPWETSPNNRVRCKVLRYYPHLIFSVQMRCMLRKTCDGQIAKVPKKSAKTFVFYVAHCVFLWIPLGLGDLVSMAKCHLGSVLC